MPTCGECLFFKPDVVNDDEFIESHDGVIGPFEQLGGCHGFYEYLQDEGEDDFYYIITYHGRRYIVFSGDRGIPSECPLFVPHDRDVLLREKYAEYKHGGVLFPDCITLGQDQD